jgi:HdeA/HdeB family protein
MKALKVLLIAMLSTLALPLHAQKLELASMKCSEFLQTDKESASLITAWLVGYYTEVAEAEVINLDDVRGTGVRLSSFCAEHPNFTVGAAAEGLLGR